MIGRLCTEDSHSMEGRAEYHENDIIIHFKTHDL